MQVDSADLGGRFYMISLAYAVLTPQLLRYVNFKRLYYPLCFGPKQTRSPQILADKTLPGKVLMSEPTLAISSRIPYNIVILFLFVYFAACQFDSSYNFGQNYQFRHISGSIQYPGGTSNGETSLHTTESHKRLDLRLLAGYHPSSLTQSQMAPISFLRSK